MFQKIISGLPFSPALVGQLGFYAKRLKKEEATRRIGLILTALALVVQSFAVFSPPEPANASNASDLVYGGISSLSGFLAAYDRDPYLRNVMNYNGITRGEIAAMKDSSINSRQYGTGADAWKSWGRTPHFGAAAGEVKHDANGSIVYSRPLWRWDSTSHTQANGSTYDAFVGSSAKIGQFAIIKGCGNLATRTLPPPPPPPMITVCRPGVGIITIREDQKQSGDAPSNSPLCKPQPVAACTTLGITKIDRTKFSFSANGSTSNGATIKNYRFIVRKSNANGAIVTEKTIASTGLSAASGTVTLKDSGTYHVQVVLSTSLGERTDAARCAKTITVAPEEKCETNPKLTKTDKDCQPCEGNSSLWYKDEECKEKIARTKTATNLTENKEASSTVAKAGDRIQFTITAENIGKVPAEIDFSDNLSDVLEYARVHDNGGGNIIEKDGVKMLTWGEIKLAAGEKASRTFTVTMLDEIPTTSRGTSDPSSYDCIITNTFGNSISIGVDCAAPKIVETVVEQLPSTGPTENMIFAGIITSIVTYFYARSRQLGKEVRLIRRDYNAGTI